MGLFEGMIKPCLENAIEKIIDMSNHNTIKIDTLHLTMTGPIFVLDKENAASFAEAINQLQTHEIIESGSRSEASGSGGGEEA